MQAQLTFLEEEKESELRAELDKTKKELTNTRRGLFGRFDKMVNELSALQQEMADIRENIGMKNDTDDRKVLEFPL